MTNSTPRSPLVSEYTNATKEECACDGENHFLSFLLFFGGFAGIPLFLRCLVLVLDMICLKNWSPVDVIMLVALASIR